MTQTIIYPGSSVSLKIVFSQNCWRPVSGSVEIECDFSDVLTKIPVIAKIQDVPAFVDFGRINRGEEGVRMIRLRNSMSFGFEYRIERDNPRSCLSFSNDRGMIRGQQEISINFRPREFTTLSEKVRFHVVNSPPYEILITGSCKPGSQKVQETIKEASEDSRSCESDEKLPMKSSFDVLEEKLGNLHVCESNREALVMQEKEGEKQKVRKYGESLGVFQGAVSKVIELNRLLRVLYRIHTIDLLKTSTTEGEAG